VHRIDIDLWISTACPHSCRKAGQQVIRSQLLALRYRSPISDALGTHQVLVDAVAAGDVERACELLRGHVLENEPRYRIACQLD
jgi:DNA-binding GntR family transcriptional regulator